MTNMHIAVVAWLHIFVGMFLFACVSIIWICAAGLASTFEGSFVPGLVAMFGKPIALVLLALATLQFISAVALSRGRRWSLYPLGLISFLLLFVFPIGTAMAAYTFWATYVNTNSTERST